MGACGETGLRRADEVLLRVPIMADNRKPAVNVDADGEAVPETLQEVVKVCYELGREHVRREVCSVSPQYWCFSSYLTIASDRRAEVHAAQAVWNGCLVPHLS